MLVFIGRNDLRHGIVWSYDARLAQVYATLPRSITEGVIFKLRTSQYLKERRASAKTRD